MITIKISVIRSVQKAEEMQLGRKKRSEKGPKTGKREFTICFFCHQIKSQYEQKPE